MVSFIDLVSQQDAIRPDLEARISRVLAHGQYIHGPEVEELEKALEDYVQGASAVSCSSGTDALLLALLAANVGPGDAVFVPSLTFIASAGAICQAGAQPVFVDVNPSTFTMCPEDLAEKIDMINGYSELRAKAVMPVDLFGMPADYAELGKVAEHYSLTMIADAAHSFGSRLNLMQSGTFAELTCFSFYPGKALGCYGDGGAVLTTNERLIPHLRSLRWHGTAPDHKLCNKPGMNGRLDTLQAAILLSKLRIYDRELIARKHHAERYDANLKGFVTLQEESISGEGNRGYYCIRSPHRNRIKARLSQQGIPSVPYYETPLSKMPAFRACFGSEHLPITDLLSGELLAIPMHPYLQEHEIDHISEVIVNTVKENQRP